MKKSKLSPVYCDVTAKLRKQVQNLDYVFNPKSVAIIGASRNPTKIGHAILRNFVQSGYEGGIYPINPNADEVLGLKCHKKISDVRKPVDCVIVAVPVHEALFSLQDAAKCHVPSSVVITGGFSEVGNVEEEIKIKELADRHQMALIGPNCMGVLNPAKKVDSVFLPIYKFGRPRLGSISFISQSGAVGGCIVDLVAHSGIGMSKFVSYGNATVINETDLLQYLVRDPSTKSVISYIEGVKDGRKFMETLSCLTQTKPVVVLKAGTSKFGATAALSHTGSLAGSAKIFSAALAQAGAIEANTLDELFDISKTFGLKKFFGARVAVLTNGGGNGVLAADSIEKEGLLLAEFSQKSQSALKGIAPETTTVRNPLDIIGDADAERYEKALDILIADENIDVILVIILFQTVALDSSIIRVLTKASEKSSKPLVVVSTGGEYTQLHRRIIDDYGIPTYPSPSSAVRSIARILKYNLHSAIKRHE